MGRFSLAIAAGLFATSASAWEAFDTSTGYLVEIEDGDPFTEGSEIHYRQFDSDEVRKATVVSKDWSEASVEVEIQEAESDVTRVLEFILD